jgi:hypothetical protein
MALMDVEDIEPLAAALPTLLRPRGGFVFSVMHPCFNVPGGSRFMLEEHQRGSHRILERDGWPDYTFAFRERRRTRSKKSWRGSRRLPASVPTTCDAGAL